MFACIYIPNASNDAQAALLDCAGAFSPRVENMPPGAVVFDVEGLERLFGSYSEIASKIAEAACARGLEANVALASNMDAAVCAARGFGGITVLNHGTEANRLSDLPPAVLSASPEILETLERWGIRTLGAFAKLPAVDVSARFGQEGIELHKRARGVGSRPLVPHVDRVRFVDVVELDYEIVTIEPLTFILSRMLDGICTRLRSRNFATHEVHLSLGPYWRVLNLPLPVRNPNVLTRLLILDLEAHPPGVGIRRVEIEAVPAKPRVVQNGLFVPLSPEPEKLELTLARVKAVVGEENVGAAEIQDTHRPDAFRVCKFRLSKENISKLDKSCISNPKFRNIKLDPALSTVQSAISDFGFEMQDSSNFKLTALRRFRPPLQATVQLRNNTPIWIAFHGVHGPIATSRGPWRTSGDWWRPTMWDREEWDIKVLDALYRIYFDVHMDRWYAEGVYD